MAKRDRDSIIWKDPFYINLPPLYKCFWDYINDDCDNAGVYMVDLKTAKVKIGKKIDPKHALELYGCRIHVFDEGRKWYITTFIRDILGFRDLSPAHKFQKSIMDLLAKHQIENFKHSVDTLASVQTREGKEETVLDYKQRVEEKLMQAFDDMTIERYCMHPNFKGIDIHAELANFKLKASNAWKEDYGHRDISGLRNGFQKQLEKAGRVKTETKRVTLI